MLNSAIQMFEATAARYPNQMAAQDTQGEISFSALRSRAIGIGTALLDRIGAANGFFPVIVYLPKSIDALACILGAQYSGNPYAPVNIDVPPARLQSIIDNLGPSFLLTNQELAPRLEALHLEQTQVLLLEDIGAGDESRTLAAVAQVIDSDPLYIMFTSGSTGVPKGVTIPHRGAIDYAVWLQETFHFDNTTVLGNESAFYFDNSTLDIYIMCLTGAKMVMIPNVLFRFPTKLMEFVAENHINTIFWVPTEMAAVANTGALENQALPELQTIIFAGEAMPNRQLNVWRRALPGRVFANLYGPTEITVDCTCYIVDREFADTDPLPIGKACRNMRILVLREDGSSTDVGEIGELCVLGSGLARGYWNNPEQTRKVFTQNPLCKAYDDRMYHTGDLAYWAADGNLMFVGRADFQIKRRGSRIEPGDIETAAKGVPAVENACVLYRAETEDIVLFVQTKEPLQLRKLNLELRKLLPSYMLPTQLRCLEELPQTPNGKIDRQTLKGML